MYSVAIEDYLKSLWKLGPKDVGTQELASHLDVKPASVTKMVLRLTEMGLVDHTPYKGASLTRQGELEALSVVLPAVLIKASAFRDEAFRRV